MCSPFFHLNPGNSKAFFFSLNISQLLSCKAIKMFLQTEPRNWNRSQEGLDIKLIALHSVDSKFNSVFVSFLEEWMALVSLSVLTLYC